MDDVSAPRMEEVVTRDGLRFVVDPSDGRGQELIASAGDFNVLSVRIFQALLARRRWDLVVDIGANYGEMIAAIPATYDAQVVAFEPNDHLHPFLRRTAELNDVAVSVRPEAVGRTDARARFALDRTWSGRSSLKCVAEARSTDLVDVDVVCLDSVFRGAQPSTALVKIDVEGGEGDVLAGAATFLAGLDDCAIQIEILHMAAEEIAAIAGQWKTYLVSRTTLAPVRLPGDDSGLAALYVGSGRFYQNDAVLLPRTTDLPLTI